jgi:hypothetical protein
MSKVFLDRLERSPSHEEVGSTCMSQIVKMECLIPAFFRAVANDLFVSFNGFPSGLQKI